MVFRAATHDQGSIADRPAAGRSRRFYFAVDEGKFYYDDGIKWHELGKEPPFTFELAVGIIPEGLAWDGTNLWIVDRGTNIKQFDTTGTQLSTIPFPVADAGRCQGLTWDGQYLWLSEWDQRRVWQLSRTDGTVIHSVPAPDRGDGFGDTLDGLAWDGTNLWGAGRASNKVYQFNTTDGAVITQWTTTLQIQREMSWKNNELWLVDDIADLIYQIATDGTVIDQHVPPGTGPSGLDWTQDGYLWHADDGTDKVYRLAWG